MGSCLCCGVSKGRQLGWLPPAPHSGATGKPRLLGSQRSSLLVPQGKAQVTTQVLGSLLPDASGCVLAQPWLIQVFEE